MIRRKRRRQIFGFIIFLNFVDSRMLSEMNDLSGVARRMPCCKESIGAHVCAEMRQKRPYEFKIRCRTDADFAMLQCCRSCQTNVAQLGRELFAHGPNSRHCYDRHGRRYCSQFVRRTGMWASYSDRSSGCNGENSALAFRVCRRSCGFCRVDLYKEETEKGNCKSKVERRVSPPPAPAILPVGTAPDFEQSSVMGRIVDELGDAVH